jgi:hypothetical protein
LRKSGPSPKGFTTGKRAANTATNDAKAVESIVIKKKLVILDSK